MMHDPEYYMLPADKQELIHKSVVDKLINDLLERPHPNDIPLTLKGISDRVYDIGSCCMECEDCPHCNEYSDPDTVETYHGCTHIVPGRVVKVHPNHICNEAEHRVGYRYAVNNRLLLLMPPEKSDLVPKEDVLTVIGEFINDANISKTVTPVLQLLYAYVKYASSNATYCKDCELHIIHTDPETGTKRHGCKGMIQDQTVIVNQFHLCTCGIRVAEIK